MEKNLFISNSSKQKILGFLKLNRAFFVALVIIGFMDLFSCKIADVVQDGTKQVVRCKRQWVRTDEISKQAGGQDIVLFLGNSKIVAGIIPEVFDRANGHKIFSFNLALSALPLGPNYFMLKDYLQHNPPPKYIVTTLDPGGLRHGLMPYYAPINAGLWEVIEYSWYRKDWDLLINYLFPIRFYWPEVRIYMIRRILPLVSKSFWTHERQKFVDQSKNKETFQHDWDNWYRLKYLDFEEASQERERILRMDRGYYYIVEQAALGGQLPDDYVAQENKKSKALPVSQKEDFEDPFVKRFFDLALSKGIKVILISGYALGPRGSHTAVVSDTWASAQKKYRNVYFSRFEPRYYEPKYFSDPVHVNRAGATRYTLEIAEEFKDIVYGSTGMAHSSLDQSR